MALADFKAFTQNVTYRDTVVLQVRGLSLDDLGLLIRSHMTDLTVLIELARSDRSNFGTISFFIQALQKAPDVMFDVIALAADEPDYSAEARKMPVGLQVKTLQQIFEMTLEDVGGPKGLVALAQQMIPTLGALNQQATPFSLSTGSNERQ